jgi:hypothetical protein
MMIALFIALVPPAGSICLSGYFVLLRLQGAACVPAGSSGLRTIPGISRATDV